ncbi:hypothetical protein SAY87_021094 [Trapa incisa]|uniref:Growth-regulating factor n=1 Tax=Trapa incisa TaxID=236973 RepID=A0AAN7PQI7_9MYRT|nr:hypothetical protein SAY87_021094 [Trapa incisa]
MLAPSVLVTAEANGGWTGGRGLWAVMVGAEDAAGESKPSLSLCLGIGGTDNEFEREKPVELTRAQISELYHQSLVHNYLAARLPVPPHLLLPLRKSELTSSHPTHVGVPQLKHQSTSIGFRQEALDYINIMIPDPERCRRTDGKKWRCSKKVVPHQKYCESHVNRGQQRWRRPLQIARIASPTEDDLRHSKADITLGLGLNTGLSSEVNSPNRSSLNVKDGYGASMAIVSSSSSSGTSLSSHGIYQAEAMLITNIICLKMGLAETMM